MARPPLVPLLVVSCSLSVVACSHGARPAAEPSAEQDVVRESSEQPALVGETGSRDVASSPRRVGDRFVHRFSGRYRAEALVLLEEVVEREGDVLVVDYRVLEGEKRVHLRVRRAVRSERIVEVREKVDGTFVKSDVEVFEELMAQTVFAPDRNRGLVASENRTCLVGADEHDCRVSTYDVRVDGEPARLSVVRSAELDRDLSGEIVAVDGTVLYKADLVELERGSPGSRDDAEATAALETPDWVRRD